MSNENYNNKCQKPSKYSDSYVEQILWERDMLQQQMEYQGQLCWIPFGSEKRPDEDEVVVICGGNNSYTWYQTIKYHEGCFNGKEHEITGFTHWARLTPPRKEGE